MVSKKDFFEIVEIIIDTFEGGYYHPNMFKDGRISDPTGRLWKIYETSGETMYGLDRKNGGSLNTSASGKLFWSVIDTQKAKDRFPWNYPLKDKDKVELIGGVTLEQFTSSLKYQLSLTMRPLYDRLSKKYLNSKAIQIVESSRPLLLHFVYACWNGSGFFKTWSEHLIDDINHGIVDPIELFKNQMELRKESEWLQIKNSGIKMERIAFNLIAPSVMPQKKSSLLIYAVILIALYFFVIKR